jgi:hypothetical protein
MQKCVNGEMVDMTPEEIKEFNERVEKKRAERIEIENFKEGIRQKLGLTEEEFNFVVRGS